MNTSASPGGRVPGDTIQRKDENSSPNLFRCSVCRCGRFYVAPVPCVPFRGCIALATAMNSTSYVRKQQLPTHDKHAPPAFIPPSVLHKERKKHVLHDGLRTHGPTPSTTTTALPQTCAPDVMCRKRPLLRFPSPHTPCRFQDDCRISCDFQCIIPHQAFMSARVTRIAPPARACYEVAPITTLSCQFSSPDSILNLSCM